MIITTCHLGNCNIEAADFGYVVGDALFADSELAEVIIYKCESWLADLLPQM